MSRRLLVAEVVQSSAMDCGPAALKAIADGFGIELSYGRLREACHTEVDGTSIDTIEELALEIGLDAEQVLIPVDHVLLDGTHSAPSIAVVKDATGAAHFVVLWRRHGPFVQVMDPARGRLWLHQSSILQNLYVHSTSVPAADWRAWAGTNEFLEPLDRQLQRVGLSRAERRQQIERAIADPTCRGLSALDAAARMVRALLAARSVTRREARTILDRLTEDAGDSVRSLIPEHFWSAREQGADRVYVRGAVLVLIKGTGTNASEARQAARSDSDEPRRSSAVAAALGEKPLSPLRDAFRFVGASRGLMFSMIAAATAIAVAGVVFEAALLRSILDAGMFLRLPEQGLIAGIVLAAFGLAMLGLEFTLASLERQTGRHLESRLRIAFFDKLPRLSEAYFQSRAISDMAERSHMIHVLRSLPQVVVRVLRTAMEIIVTTLAIIWLAPHMVWLAILAAMAGTAIPLLGHAMLAERDLRLRTHAGGLTRFQLDALLGRTAIDASGAGGTVEREHERLLDEWIHAGLRLQRGSLLVEGVQMTVGLMLAAWILFGHLGSLSSGTLLLAYWVLQLPALGYELAMHVREYPVHRSVILRLLEPLGAPNESDEVVPAAREIEPAHDSFDAVHIEARHLAVAAGGHGILEHVDFTVPAASHIAIVGVSGAGKSTLMGVLLGKYRASEGTVLIDGQPLEGRALEQLRADTAWVDPTVQIWNRSLLENLEYGSTTFEQIGAVIEEASLSPVIARLKDGLATTLGERGRLLSAGEAQLVRVGRSLLKANPRLVILDEPFMGLERERRRALLSEMRRRWAKSTLFYVTHEISEARSFERVLVLEGGRIVEDGNPQILAQSASSRYRRLLQAQETANSRIGGSSDWHRLRLHEGRIIRDLGNGIIEHTA